MAFLFAIWPCWKSSLSFCCRVGEDEKILDEREQLNPNDMYGIYSNDEQAMEEEGGGFDINEAEMLIRDLKANEPDLFKRVCNLPDGIRAGLASDVAGTFVFCGVGKRYKRMYLVDDKTNIIASDPAEIVPLLRCDRDTPGQPLPQTYNQTVEAVRQLFAEYVERIYQSLSHPALESDQQYTIEQLLALRQDLFITDSRKHLLDHLISAVGQQLPSYVVSALRKLKREKRSGDDLLDTVDNIVRYYELDIGQDRAVFGSSYPADFAAAIAHFCKTTNLSFEEPIESPFDFKLK